MSWPLNIGHYKTKVLRLMNNQSAAASVATCVATAKWVILRRDFVTLYARKSTQIAVTGIR